MNKPARIISLRYRNISGKVHSEKGSTYSKFESSLEKDALILAEFSPDVLTFTSQPRTFHFQNNGKSRKYTPDLLLEFNNGQKIYIEVKYRVDIKKDWVKLKPKFKAVLSQIKAEKDTYFRIWSEVEIRTQYLKNAKFLLPYKHRPINEYQGCMILKVINSITESTPEEIISLCSKSESTRPEFLYSLWACLAKGFLKTNMMLPLTMKSPIWIGDIYQSEDTKWHWINK